MPEPTDQIIGFRWFFPVEEVRDEDHTWQQVAGWPGIRARGADSREALRNLRYLLCNHLADAAYLYGTVDLAAPADRPDLPLLYLGWSLPVRVWESEEEGWWYVEAAKYPEAMRVKAEDLDGALGRFLAMFLRHLGSCYRVGEALPTGPELRPEAGRPVLPE